MQAALQHRGPDGAGDYSDSHVALAMRRLSIIDPDHGWQPLFSEDQTKVLVANGEIYNYVELREELVRRGHQFATGSDCEVIVHLYEECGEQCLEHLRGMFAFAVWDKRAARLMLARDRMGEKPLYLYTYDGGLFFASEMKSLLRCGKIPLDIDPESLHVYFHYQYVPDPRTPFRHIRKLPAAHFLTIDAEEAWHVSATRYWRISDAGTIDADPATTIREELRKVSKLVVRSDVPVGVALSGGVDSSVIAAMAVNAGRKNIEAFCVGYEGQVSSDERSAAREFADHLGISLHEIEVTTDGCVDSFPELVTNRDDPIADISGYGYHCVSDLARRHGVPVLLQGQGGDELFWGYSWLREAVRDCFLKDRIRSVGVLALTGFLRRNLPHRRSRKDLLDWVRSGLGIPESLREYAEANRNLDRPFYYLNSDLAVTARFASDGLFGAALQQEFEPSAGWLEGEDDGLESWDIRLTAWILRTYLLENGISQGDRLSMANSVELRLPLVDYRLVETVIGLRKGKPDHLKPRKHWLREAAKDIVPGFVFDRPKRGFTPPVAEWHSAAFRSYGQNLIGGALERLEVLTPSACSDLAAGPWPEDQCTPLSFKALVLEVWFRRMLGEQVLRCA